jgi:hypothetical protein
MPAIDFPSAPAVNDEYSFEGRTWLWNGTGWEVKPFPAALQLGTAANPSLYFTGDPNTGIYSPGADQVAISTNGTGRLFVDASGRVGIGNASPTTTLHIAGVTPILTIEDTSGATAGVESSCLLRDNDNFQIQLRSAANAFVATAYLIANDAASITSHQWRIGNTERMRLDSSGRLGLGTSSPATILDVNGDVTIADKIIHNADTNTAIRFPAADTVSIETNGSERARIDSSGRLLVGTSTTPPAVETIIPRFVSSSAAGVTGAQDIAIYNYQNAVGSGRTRVGPKLLLGNSRSAVNGSLGGIVANNELLGNIRFAGDDGSAFITAAEILAEVDGTPGANDMPGRLVFSTTADGASSPTERMRINSAGNVGIGTTTPFGKLHIQDDANNVEIFAIGPTTGSSRIRFGDSDDSNIGQIIYDNTNDSLQIHVNNSERLRIDSSGRLLVGTSVAYVAGGNITSRLQLHGIDASNSSWQTTRWSANNGSPFNSLQKSRGASVGTREIVIANDDLGTLSFSGDDGTNFVQAATIRTSVDGTPSTAGMPGRLVFSTTADGAAIPTERMRIDSAGFVSLAGDTNTGFSNPSADNLAITTGGSERARIDSSGRLLVGTSTNVAINALNTGLQISNLATNNGASISIARYNNDASAGEFIFGKSRSGINASPGGIIQNGDTLGVIRWVGDNGTDLSSSAATILAAVDGEPGTAGDLTDIPSRLVFTTSPDGAASPTERFRITNEGVQAYNQAAPAAVNATATLTVANLKTGIITSTSAAATDMTLPTGTDTQAGFSGTYDNMTFEWSVINTGPSLVQVLAATAHTIVGSGSVATGTSGRFASRRTAANTFVSYRLS